MPLQDSGSETNGDALANGSDGPSILFPTYESDSGIALTGEVTGRKLIRLLDRQGRRCALSGAELSPATVSLDHIVPMSGDGLDDMANVQLVHQTVNDMKGTMSQGEFVRWCSLVAANAKLP